MVLGFRVSQTPSKVGKIMAPNLKKLMFYILLGSRLKHFRGQPLGMRSKRE